MRPHKAKNKTGVTKVKGAAYVPFWKSKITQEYIPVGCVPPASVTVSPARTASPPRQAHPLPLTQPPRHARPLFCMSPTMHVPLLCMPPHYTPPCPHATLPFMPPATHVPCHACPVPWHAHLLPCTPLWTDRCKNITFPQLRFRAVKMVVLQIRLDLTCGCLFELRNTYDLFTSVTLCSWCWYSNSIQNYFLEQLKGQDSKPSMQTIIQNIHVFETFIKLYEMIEICILTCNWTFTAVLAQA